MKETSVVPLRPWVIFVRPVLMVTRLKATNAASSTPSSRAHSAADHAAGGRDERGLAAAEPVRHLAERVLRAPLEGRERLVRRAVGARVDPAVQRLLEDRLEVAARQLRLLVAASTSEWWPRTSRVVYSFQRGSTSTLPNGSAVSSCRCRSPLTTRSILTPRRLRSSATATTCRRPRSERTS